MAYSVLVVEDNPFQLQYLLELFGSLGGVIAHPACNGQHALDLLKTQRVDMVLSDLMMPGMDGVQLIQRLAELEHKPVLAFMSIAYGRMLSSASLAATSLGFRVAGVLSKPVRFEALHQLIERGISLDEGCVATLKAPTPFSSSDLTEAISSGEIQPWFQPKQSLVTGRIVAAEALARWSRTDNDLLMPRDFLPGIIRHNLEEALLMQFVARTIGAQSAWRRQGYDVPVSINLPTHLLASDDLPDRLHDLVLARGGMPSKISFELMENSSTEQAGHYFAGVCRLRFKGFGLAQDDFGKGYSSYFNLVSTPFTELKIDRSLVSGCVENENLEAALTSIVALGKKLGLNVVAEGVETAGELALLSKLDCDQVQGFLISKAVHPQQFLGLLSANGPGRNGWPK